MNILDIGSIGIDFGSYKTVICLSKKFSLEILLNVSSSRESPNIIGFTENETLFGDQAYMKLKSNFKNTVLHPMRFINPTLLSSEDDLDNEKQYQGATIIRGDQDSIYFAINYMQNTKEFAPIQILALILSNFSKKNLQNTKHDISKYGFAISVPAYFTSEERVTLSKAALIAGINLVKILNESTAVSLIYRKIHDEDLLTNYPQGKKVLFIDVGFSKSGVFLSHFYEGAITVVQEFYDRFLGIRDIDMLLFQFYTTMLKKQNPSYKENFKSKLRISENIEKQRKVLSANNDAQITIESLFEDYDLIYTLTRQEFENIISPFLEKLKALFLRFQIECELQGKTLEFDEIEIIGGGVRVPVIQRMINEVFKKENLSKTLNSTECFSMGAALYRSKAVGSLPTPNISYINEILYYSIYYEIKPDGLTDIIVLNRGVSYPCVTSVKIPNNKQKTSITFYYYVQEHKDHKNIIFEVDLENESDGVLDIQVGINDDGVFVIKDIKKNDKKVNLSLKKDVFETISDKTLEKLADEHRKIEDQNQIVQAKYEIKNQIESYIYSKRSDLLEKYKNHISNETKEELTRFFKIYEQWVHDADLKTSKQFYEQKFKEIKQKIDPLFEECLEKNENDFLNSQAIKTFKELSAFRKGKKNKVIDNLNLDFASQDIGDGGGLLRYFKNGMNQVKNEVNSFKIQDLLRLDLRNNGLTDISLDFLIEIINFQTDLKALDILANNSSNFQGAKNSFSGIAVYKFIENLKRCFGLRKIKIALPTIDEVNFKVLIVVFEGLPFIERIELHVDSAKISDNEQKTFLKMNTRNKSIKVCKLTIQEDEK